LGALRDGLIQVLAMIQGEMASRPAQPSPATAGGPAPSAATAVAAASRAATDRIMRLNAPATFAQDATPAGVPIEQDIKLAMGLLLKHRGGPGFGHGRLQGKELDLMAERLRAVSGRLLEEAAAEHAQ
jgi:hypothetical protein